MRAVVFDKKQSLRFAPDWPDPVLQAGQVLLKLEACGVCGSDNSLIKSGLAPEGYIFGHEFAGRIHHLTPEAEKTLNNMQSGLTIGSRVMVRPSFCGHCPSCLKNKPHLCLRGRRSTGIGDLPGGFAEYVVAYPEMLIPVPEELSPAEAALTELFATALHGLDKIPAARQSVLIMGGGAVGLALIQLLRLNGCRNIALSEPQEAKHALARSLGATHVANPFAQPLDVFLQEQGLAGQIEAVFECAGVPANIKEAADLVAPGGGVCLLGLNFLAPMAEINTLNMNLKEVSIIASMSDTHADNIRCLSWLKNGLLNVEPLITDRIALEELPAVYAARICTGQAIKVLVEM